MHSYGLDTSIKFNNTTNKNKTINQPFDSNNPKLQYLHEVIKRHVEERFNCAFR